MNARPESKRTPPEGDLTAAGDLMQSAASRVTEWLFESETVMPYEVVMATMELQGAIKDWTEARRV